MADSHLSDEAWRQRTFLLAGLAAAAVVAMAFVKPIPQPLGYHDFRDGRALLGIPNVLNVLSNLPFLLVGLIGLRWVQAQSPEHLDPELRVPYSIVFSGLAATALGSAYYHWTPNNVTLVWDRLPIAMSFMGLYAAVLAERVTLKMATLFTLPLVALGGLSVGYWSLTDDLRPYLLAQFLPVLTIPLILWLYPARYTRGADFLVGIGFYALAKLLEEFDAGIYGALGMTLSGHTLKHLAAAVGAYWIYRMLKERTFVARQ